MICVVLDAGGTVQTQEICKHHGHSEFYTRLQEYFLNLTSAAASVVPPCSKSAIHLAWTVSEAALHL